MLDVNRLRLLRELAVHGTIAATARACSLTPSAVSQQLSALQREAGARLLVRDGRGVTLTAAARVLVAHTERVLAELERAEAGVAGLSDRPAGTVRLAAFPTAASALVPAAIAACREQHPDLTVLLEEQEPAEGIAALKSGHLDVVIVYEYNLLPGVDDHGVRLTPLVTESLLAAVPSELIARLAPDQRGGDLRLEALRGLPWIAPSSDRALRVTLDRACGLAGFAPQVDFTSDDYTVIVALVRAGLGVSLLPQLAVEGLSAGVQLHPVVEPALSRSVSVAVRAGSSRSPGIAVVLRALRRAAAGLHINDEPVSPR